MENDFERLRAAILQTMRRTREPMMCRHIAAYLRRRGWTGHMEARVASHLGTLRQRGDVKYRKFHHGNIRPIRLRNGQTIEREALGVWYLPKTSTEVVVRKRREFEHFGPKCLRKPPDPMPRTDDMRQMLADFETREITHELARF